MWCVNVNIEYLALCAVCHLWSPWYLHPWIPKWPDNTTIDQWCKIDKRIVNERNQKCQTKYPECTPGKNTNILPETKEMNSAPKQLTEEKNPLNEIRLNVRAFNLISCKWAYGYVNSNRQTVLQIRTRIVATRLKLPCTFEHILDTQACMMNFGNWTTKSKFCAILFASHHKHTVKESPQDWK